MVLTWGNLFTNQLVSSLLSPRKWTCSHTACNKYVKKLILCFVTAENLSQKAQTEKVKQRLVEHKEKRQIESKLSLVKPLGESDEDDDSSQAWVARSRKMQEERVQAEKRVRMVYFHVILSVTIFNTTCFSHTVITVEIVSLLVLATCSGAMVPSSGKIFLFFS